MDIQEFAERVGDGTETSGTRQNICRKFMEIVYLYIINIVIKHSVLSAFLRFYTRKWIIKVDRNNFL